MTTDEMIDGIVDDRVEATEGDAPEETVEDAQPEKAEKSGEENPEDESEEKSEGDSDKGGDDWPKTARTAVRNRDRRIGNLYKRIRELEEAAQQAQPQQQPETGAPKEDDFDNYADFIKAQAVYEVTQILEKEKGAKMQPADELTVQEQQYIAHKQQETATKSAEYARTIPDYQEVVSDNAELINSLPKEIQRIFFDAQDTALATYNLAKSGELADLLFMTPTQAAMKIAQAQVAPQLTPPPQPKHKPMQGAKGTASVRSDDALSGKELLNKYGVR